MTDVRRPVPSYSTFEQALKRGALTRMEDGTYTRWVKQLPCCACMAPADDPHHPYDVGFGGGATKVPDYWCIPLCRSHHDELHHDVGAWESYYGPQMHHALLTMTRAIYEGILK